MAWPRVVIFSLSHTPQQKGHSMANIKVRNMESPRSNRPVPNQFIIESKNSMLFQSYSSPIIEVCTDKPVIKVYPNWNYSATTNKYRNIFMRDVVGIHALANTEGIRKAIKDEMYCGYSVVMME